MTLDQLRIFIAVAAREHVKQAASVLHLSPSAVSAAIQALEARHGVPLFERVGRGIRLTQAGHLFLAQAQTVLAQAEAAEALLEELAGGTRGRLVLGASQTIASYWLPRHLALFRLANPEIELELSIGNSATVAEAVRQGRAELGFIEGEVQEPDLLRTQVARDAMVLLVAPGHGWGRTVNQAEITATPWVLREPGSGTRAVFETAMAARDIDPASLNLALELPSNEAVRGAVEAGLGATILSSSVAAPSLEAGLLRQVEFPLPDRSFYLLRAAKTRSSPAARAFMARLGVSVAQ